MTSWFLSRVVAHGRRAWYARGDDLCLLTRADTGHAAITHAARVLRPVGGYHDAIVPAFDAMLYPNDRSDLVVGDDGIVTDVDHHNVAVLVDRPRRWAQQVERPLRTPTPHRLR